MGAASPDRVGADPRPTIPVAPPRQPFATVTPDGTGVDPYLVLQSEPASLGITDYGVNSAGNGYAYSTPIWWADANISRLLAYYPSDSNGNGGVTLQLNVVLRLVSPSHTPFAYWIQDVIAVNTITKVVAYEDNVWNLSAGGSIETGTLSGNGSVNPFNTVYFYGDGPACQGSSGGYAGNCVTLHYPAIVTVRVTTGRYGGVPHVSFQYGYEGTWVTYDNVSFPFAGNYADNDFTVDGTQYTPYSLFYDAEWDYTGPGGQMEDRNSSLAMQLERWNGHNLQAPPNAYNFGSNTGESISNVVSAAELNTANGTVGADVSTGPGTLGPLYFAGDVASLNVSTPTLAAPVITIDGEPHAFVGSTAVFTLAAGTYNVSLWDSGHFVASASATLSQGVTTDLYLGYPNPYTVDFVEQGLPGGLGWSLTVNGIPYSNPGPSLGLELTNGSYNYTVAPVPGYTTPVYRGTFAVAGGSVTVFVNFSAYLLPVEFSESGLPLGISWTVTLGGVSQADAGTSLSFTEPNGTYPFTVDAGLLYLPTPSASAVVVQGLPAFQSIAFSLQPGYLTGRVTPSSASLYVGGSSEPTDQGAFNVTLLPGEYTVEFAAAGFISLWTNVTIAPATTTPLGVILNQSVAPPGGGGPGGGSGSGLTTDDAILLVGGAVLIAVVAVAAAAVAARRRR